MSKKFDKNLWLQNIIIKTVEQIIQKQKLNNPFILYGVVSGISGTGYKLNAYINGSDTPTTDIPYDPDKTFSVGDHVVILAANRNMRDLFVLCRRDVS